MFHKVNLTCGPDEVRHIRIACRCGEVTVHDLPMQIERSETLLVCPKCSSAFTAVRTDLTTGAANGGFTIRRIGGKDDIKYVQQ